MTNVEIISNLKELRKILNVDKGLEFEKELKAVDGAIKVLERSTGHWIPIGYDGYADGSPVIEEWECSECGWEHSGDSDTLTPYYPNCSAKMESEGSDGISD